MAARFEIRGIEPSDDPAWVVASESLRRQYWRAVVLYAKDVKDDELAAGLDKRGRPLRPIAASTRKHRTSEMGPADPSAPPLMPAYAVSRTRLNFTGRAFADHAEFYWTEGWGKILEIHAGLRRRRRKAKAKRRLPIRDVIGISPRGLAKIKRLAMAWWAKHRQAQGVVSLPQPVAASVARPAPRLVVNGRTDYDRFTFGIGASGAPGPGVQATGMAQRRPGEGLPAFGGPGTIPPRPPGPAGPPRPRGPRPVGPAVQSARNLPSPTEGGRVRREASASDLRRVKTAVFGRDVDDVALASLAGTTDGAPATITVLGDEIHVYWQSAKLNGPAHRVLHRSATGERVLTNASISIREEHQGQGLGSAIFDRQVANAIAMGFDEIRTRAGRQDGPGGMTGYKVWPRMGYDAVLPIEITDRLPASLRGAAWLSDLMRTAEGRSWWDEHGETIEVSFDLRSGSLSRQVWEARRARRGTGPT